MIKEFKILFDSIFSNYFGRMKTINSSSIQLYKLLRLKLGEQETEELISFVKQEVEETVSYKTEHLATKEDLAKTKSEMILWAFVFWATQLAAMFAMLKALK